MMSKRLQMFVIQSKGDLGSLPGFRQTTEFAFAGLHGGMGNHG
jgi:hypothetical protein